MDNVVIQHIITNNNNNNNKKKFKMEEQNNKKKYWKNSTGITITRICVGARLVQKKSRELKK